MKIAVQEYTGEPITLTESDIKVTVKGQTLTPDQYRIVPSSYKNNMKKGTASVTIEGRGDYGGTKIVKFKIKAKGFSWWEKLSKNNMFYIGSAAICGAPFYAQGRIRKSAALLYAHEGENAYVNQYAKELTEKEGHNYVKGQNQEYNDELIQKGIQAATDLGMYVIIDWYMLNYNPNEY